MNKNYINYSDLPEEIQFKDEFKDIFYKMEYSQENMFVTGKAGSGKTTLLEYFRINSSKNFIILASTGISAIKAKGKTIHSFFLFPPRILINEKIQKLRGKVINNVETSSRKILKLFYYDNSFFCIININFVLYYIR